MIMQTQMMAIATTSSMMMMLFGMAMVPVVPKTMAVAAVASVKIGRARFSGGRKMT